ncbi:MAG TPA: protein translocase subunit SecD [Kofleriaceae bacterium]|nr:protein translocase subunit SecD [Kofleriaceae bacterium]
MDRNIKWRTFWLALLTVLAVMVLMPSITDSTPPWMRRMFSRKVQLGLDLQGGWHIVYSIDLNRAVDDKAQDIKRDLETSIDDEKGAAIEARVLNPPTVRGGLTVVLQGKDQAKRDQDRDKIKSYLDDYDEVLVSRDCETPPEQDAMCWRVSSDYAEGLRSAALTQAVATIRERIDERGIAEPTVISKGDQIIVELPGLDKESIERTKALIERTARLEFRMVAHNSDYMRKLYGIVESDPEAKRHGIEGRTDTWTQEDSSEPFHDYYLTAEDEKRSFSVADAKERGCWNRNLAVDENGEVECNIEGRQILRDYIAGLVTRDDDHDNKPDHADLVLDPHYEMGYEFEEARQAARDEDSTPERWRSYYLERQVQLGGSAIVDAQVMYNQTTNRAEVLVTFDRWGGKRFGDMTAEHVGHKMAIILDEKVKSAPVIQGAIRGGRSTITMGASDPNVAEKEAKDLVAVLKTGSLVAPLVEESSSEVGPLLGRDAIRRTQMSFVLGIILVIVVMLYFYRVCGSLAIMAVTLNVLFQMALLTVLGATLTLPGIAALVLTVGMGVDGNIIIYERIRDELRLGKSVRGAVDAGFLRGFAAILDGHVTTACAGWVLYQYGSGPIRGFAVMLLIGIATTLFTATWCTRLFLDHYVTRRRAVIISI